MFFTISDQSSAGVQGETALSWVTSVKPWENTAVSESKKPEVSFLNCEYAAVKLSVQCSFELWIARGGQRKLFKEAGKRNRDENIYNERRIFRTRNRKRSTRKQNRENPMYRRSGKYGCSYQWLPPSNASSSRTSPLCSLRGSVFEENEMAQKWSRETDLYQPVNLGDRWTRTCIKPTEDSL